MRAGRVGRAGHGGGEEVGGGLLLPHHRSAISILKQTLRGRITVTSSFNEISTDELRPNPKKNIVFDEALCRRRLSTRQRKFPLCIPFLGIARPQSQFLHSCICDRFIYFQHRSFCFAAAKYVDRSWEYISCSQTHECRNWD